MLLCCLQKASVINATIFFEFIDLLGDTMGRSDRTLARTQKLYSRLDLPVKLVFDRTEWLAVLIHILVSVMVSH